MVRWQLGFGRVWAVLFSLAVFIGGTFPLDARDAFVLISGGDSPFANNFSQYLQAKAIATSFERSYPRNSVWIFFGAGNVEGEKAFFGDVRHQSMRDGVLLDSWVPGSLRHNRPAKRDVILTALRHEILPTVARGGTLYLFIGDHGSRTEGKDAESIINLWSLDREPTSERGWRSSDKESLGVAELRTLFAEGLGKGRVVFCMTQCHAGGFHYLSVPRSMTPNAAWFSEVPSWARSAEDAIFPRVAGFTATDELSPAAGCDPNPDPEQWAGYERFVPERLFGIDMFTLKRNGKGLRSFADAHVAATLVDGTIDNPYSTSEQYLERWANLIETRLAKETNLTAKAKLSLAAYQRAVDGATSPSMDRGLRERQALFARFVQTLVAQNPSLKNLLASGTRQQLEQAIDPPRGRAPSGPRAQQRPDPEPNQPQRQGRRGGGGQEALRLWNDTVRPAWKRAVEVGQVAGLLGLAGDFEKRLLRQESGGSDYFSAGARVRLQEEAFWQSGYSDPQTLNTARAEAVVRWAMERRTKILAWAKSSENETLRAAAERITQLRGGRRSNSGANPPSPVSATREPVSRETAAERTLFYRRVLAAWEFLGAMDERPALKRVRELTELERTPLPRGR